MLLYRISKVFLAALGLSALLHLLLLALAPKLFNGPNGNLPEPDHVKVFTRHDPQLTRPIELRKVPLPKRLPVPHERRLAPARRPQAPAMGVFPTRAQVHPLPLPSPTLTINAIGTEGAGPTLGPTMPTGGDLVGITRYAPHQLDMHLELLDVNSLDIGRYRAKVVQDPDDRQAIRGFVKLGMVMPVRTLSVTRDLSVQGRHAQEINELARALNEYTGVQAEVVEQVTLDDHRLMEVPVLVGLFGKPNEAELRNLTQYLMAGGFVMGGMYSLEEDLFAGLEKYGGLVRGRDFYSQVLPKDHLLYRTFFDIPGGLGSRSLQKENADGRIVTKVVDCMVGYYLKGRLVGIDPIESWRWVDHSNPMNASHELMFAINVVIYALTQEGSLTQRLIRAN
ncbi:MAG: DUF4159 domain-containing protein [Candidatus Latescibacteria bacterium]|nr:DUF4159 domain-containing protein [Candidatus Latescibacterota bacterium]